MVFPDRIDRTVELTQPPPTVWKALTTSEGLGAWFGDRATIDLRPGGVGELRWDNGVQTELRIERVEEPRVFSFTWRLVEMPEEDARRTHVEFRLEASGDGTRLTVTESGFAQLPDDDYDRVYDSHTTGWQQKLGELAEYVDGR